MLLAGAGCTSSSDHVSGTTGALPACTWPAGLGTLDASVDGACTAARAYYSCPNLDYPSNGPGMSNCQDACGPGEYAVICGGVIGGPRPSPPSGCRTLPANPSGEINVCCPCN
jgi:hypothetical protein